MSVAMSVAERAALAAELHPLSDLAPGTTLGSCRVVRVGHVLYGGVPVTVAGSDGREFQLDVLRHDPEAPGVARAGSLDVFLSNGGSGDTPTVEGHGITAIALANWLLERQRRGLPVPALLTIRERAPLLRRRG
jgi:hypothetical protein